MLLLALALVPAAQDPIHTVFGDKPEPFPGLGASVAGGADHDLDGVPDFLAGSPYHGGPPSGRVSVFRGADGALLFPELDNDHPSQNYFGWSLAVTQDVDGDGRPDLLVGARQVASVSSVPPGFADLRSGLDGALIRRHEGDHQDDSFGVDVAGLGDVDGDFVPDYAVGADQTSDFTSARGYARIFSGAGGAALHTFLGAATSDLYGESLAGVGDTTGDGVPDLLVGAPGEGGKVGYAELRSGAGYALVWKKSGGAAFDGLGRSVAAAGDVDADGALDVIAGAAGGDYARLLRGSDGALLRTLTGPADSFFGGAVAGLGDVDSDGYDDVLVGAKWAKASAGNNVGRAWIHSGFDGSVLRALEGGQVGDRYGVSVAAPGDVDLDGYPDALIGASQELTFDPGYAEVRVGRPPLVGDVHALALSAGGTQSLALDAQPALAGDLYLVLGTLGATSPGIALLGVTVPLAPDFYFLFTLEHPNTPPLQGSLGNLDAQGEAACAFTLPAGAFPSLAGLTAHHAFGVLLLPSLSVALASNPVRLAFVP